jgi:hypothetical protein
MTVTPESGGGVVSDGDGGAESGGGKTESAGGGVESTPAESPGVSGVSEVDAAGLPPQPPRARQRSHTLDRTGVLLKERPIISLRSLLSFSQKRPGWQAARPRLAQSRACRLQSPASGLVLSSGQTGSPQGFPWSRFDLWQLRGGRDDRREERCPTYLSIPKLRHSARRVAAAPCGRVIFR